MCAQGHRMWGDLDGMECQEDEPHEVGVYRLGTHESSEPTDHKQGGR